MQGRVFGELVPVHSQPGDLVSSLQQLEHLHLCGLSPTLQHWHMGSFIEEQSGMR